MRLLASVGVSRLLRKVRIIHLLILTFVTLPLTFAPIAVFADSKEGLLPPESGQGWYWDRPVTEPPPGLEVIGDPIGQQIAPGQFAGNHLYVGWDAADLDSDKREMISGIGFDLFNAGLDPEATITKFVVTLIEHSTGHNTVNPEEAKVQGIVACPWSAFYGGSTAAPLANAPEGGGKCSETKVVATPGSERVAPYPGDATADKFIWTIDLTEMMNTLWKNSENTAFSLEPNTDADKRSPTTWITAFHSGAYGEPKDPTEPFGEQTPKPGVIASVSWAPGETIGDDAGLGDLEELPAEPVDTGAVASDDSGGEQPGAPVPVQARPAAAASASKGTTPFLVWVGGFLTLVFLGLSGWLLNTDAAIHGRDRGAASALIGH